MSISDRFNLILITHCNVFWNITCYFGLLNINWNIYTFLTYFRGCFTEFRHNVGKRGGVTLVVFHRFFWARLRKIGEIVEYGYRSSLVLMIILLGAYLRNLRSSIWFRIFLGGIFMFKFILVLSLLSFFEHFFNCLHR